MSDDDVPELDQPDTERVYRSYCETCRRHGVPVRRDRADALIEEWTATIARGGVPPFTH